MAAGFITLPEWIVISGAGVALVGVMGFIFLLLMVRSNPIIKVILQAQRKGKRLAMVHYPSGQVKLDVPQYVEGDGNAAPYWHVDGTVRFKDVSGEKWESLEDIKVLHYTARSPVPVGTNQFIAIDQLNDMLAWAGFTTKGILKDVFYMIGESAKGPQAEAEAWRKLNVRDQVTRIKIQEILDYIKQNPELRYVMFRSGAFTYQTAVSVIDQISGITVANTSDTISFVEDRTRRSLADRTGDLAKYALLAAPVIFAIAIGAVIVLVGGGFVG